VQPEAPIELIRASYRTLMGPLRQHPDLGGDHETAALLNEAYAVLSDPSRRAAYDRTLVKERWRGGQRAAEGERVERPVQRMDPGRWRDEGVCPFCRGKLSLLGEPDPRCGRCKAPLMAPPTPDPAAREFFGKRLTARFTKNRPVSLLPGWELEPWAVTMRDLSLSGICVIAEATLPVDRVVWIVDDDFEALAVVVSSRRAAGAFSVHARFLTLRPVRGGLLVAARA
jgi:hypothetical protein